MVNTIFVARYMQIHTPILMYLSMQNSNLRSDFLRHPSVKHLIETVSTISRNREPKKAEVAMYTTLPYNCKRTLAKQKQAIKPENMRSKCERNDCTFLLVHFVVKRQNDIDIQLHYFNSKQHSLNFIPALHFVFNPHACGQIIMGSSKLPFIVNLVNNEA